MKETARREKREDRGRRVGYLKAASTSRRARDDRAQEGVGEK